MATILCPSRSAGGGVVLMLASKYELDTTTQYWVIAILRDVVTLTSNLLTLESRYVMPLGWSIRVPSLNMIGLTVPELGPVQFSIDRQLKVPIFTFLGEKEVKFQI